ncbi:MAG: hypothetical protein ACYC9Y_03745 [Candidatus Methylomirabilia bacterium]
MSRTRFSDRHGQARRRGRPWEDARRRRPARSAARGGG